MKLELELDIHDSALPTLRQSRGEFGASLWAAAAVKWYELGQLSQERAAELAGQSRQEFLETLSRLRVSPFQGINDDLKTVRDLQ